MAPPRLISTSSSLDDGFGDTIEVPNTGGSLVTED